MRRRTTSRREEGTVLIISLAVLFTLGVLGLVFLRIVAGSTIQALFGTDRAVANELAKAGVRYAFGQLRFSEDGADWRPQPPTPVPQDVNPNLPPGLGIRSDPELDPANLPFPPNEWQPDPDYYWLRRQVDPVANDPNDKGGPDGLGCFTRVNYRNGRALIRVRYAPSGLELFSGNVARAITQRGKLRSYTLIESVGRPGNFNSLDPTSTRNPNIQNARQIAAIATIGIVEAARYVTNKSDRNQPAEVGIPGDFGGLFNGNPVQVPMIVGGFQAQTPPGLYPGNLITVGGPMYINTDMLVHGDLQVYLNADLGDQINIYGDLSYADSNSTLSIFRVNEQGGSEIINNVTALPSVDPNFTTGQGVLRDIRESQDQQGYPRAVPRKDPPLIDEEDPNTRQLRYRLATRDSGVVAGPGGGQFNLGRLGYGRGIWINNERDVQRDSEDGDFTQRYDWMNPNNGHPNSAWQGPYYVPDGCHILMFRDYNSSSPTLGGFLIARNRRTPQGRQPDTWRFYTGQDSGRHELTFKVGLGPEQPTPLVHVINEFTPGVSNFGNPSESDFAQGPVFNGVIMTEGNVRIRGVIPGDVYNAVTWGVPITVVSMATAYIEGSITKGTSMSSLAVLAKDNVVLNTTQFFSSAFNNNLQVARNNADPTSPWAIQVATGNPLHLSVQFPINPVTGNSYLQDYTFPNAGQSLVPGMFIAHASQTVTGGGSYINLLFNEFASLSPPQYLFPSANPPNAAAAFFPPSATIHTYGLAYSQQILPSYEKTSFRFFPVGAGQNGAYSLFLNGMENDIQVKKDGTISPPGGNQDYMLSRFALQPFDVRIEAVLYAQEGSFFVLPGPWFNWNPNDRRDNFVSAADRLANFNASPEYPFYGEPLNIRVTIFGSVSENFPPQMADQQEWLRKWGWMPVEYGASGIRIPNQHNPNNRTDYVPNLFINYDPVLITGRVNGSFDPTLAPSIRYDSFGRELPPMPKLPVGTKLFYFGEVNP